MGFVAFAAGGATATAIAASSEAEAGAAVPTAKESRQARRQFNRAMFRAKRDCSEEGRFNRDRDDGTVLPAPCTCQKKDGEKRHSAFKHCGATRKQEPDLRGCIQCEKNRFLHHLGACEGATDDSDKVAATADPFVAGIQACDTTELEELGYRVEPQEMLRATNKAWSKARCQCRDKKTQACDKDGGVYRISDGKSQGIKDKACRNEKFA